MASKTTLTMGEVMDATSVKCKLCGGMWFFDDTKECIKCGYGSAPSQLLEVGAQ